jgi:hypothetical protein
MPVLVELVKMAALASLVALVAVAFWTPLTAATVGVGVFWLLTVRAS